MCMHVYAFLCVLTTVTTVDVPDGPGNGAAAGRDGDAPAGGDETPSVTGVVCMCVRAVPYLFGRVNRGSYSVVLVVVVVATRRRRR